MSKLNSFAGGNAQSYLEHLERELKCAENDLKVANAYYNSAKVELDEAQAWEDKLKRYWDAIQKTDTLAAAIIAEMFKLDSQSKCVEDNASGYHSAVKIMLCCIKDVAENLEAMYDSLADLFVRIDCIRSKDPSLDWSKSILKCLAEFKAKVDAALKSAIEALKAALALLKLAHLVLSEKKALRNYIDWLQKKGQVDTAPNADSLPPGPSNCFPPDDAGSTPCEVDILPDDLCAGKTPNCMGLKIKTSTFYKESEADYLTAKNKKDHYKNEVNKAQTVRDGASAKRDSAIRALADAKAAKQCK